MTINKDGKQKRTDEKASSIYTCNSDCSVGCSDEENVIPKPKSYFRIDFPAKSYQEIKKSAIQVLKFRHMLMFKIKKDLVKVYAFKMLCFHITKLPSIALI